MDSESGALFVAVNAYLRGWINPPLTDSETQWTYCVAFSLKSFWILDDAFNPSYGDCLNREDEIARYARLRELLVRAGAASGIPISCLRRSFPEAVLEALESLARFVCRSSSDALWVHLLAECDLDTSTWARVCIRISALEADLVEKGFRAPYAPFSTWCEHSQTAHVVADFFATVCNRSPNPTAFRAAGRTARQGWFPYGVAIPDIHRRDCPYPVGFNSKYYIERLSDRALVACAELRVYRDIAKIN